MTINVALVTSDGLVMGCDSIASSVAPMIDPFSQKFAEDAQGQLLTDKDGNPFIAVKPEAVTRVVTNVMAGVTKMFSISTEPSVVAVTAGLAKFNNQTMKSLADEFRSKIDKRKRPFVNVDAIANEFLSFMRQRHVKHYRGSPLPKEYHESAEFLVGGFGRDDSFPSLFRVVVGDNKVRPEFEAGKFGLSWNGQADSVQRLIRGYDANLRSLIEGEVEALFDRHHGQMTQAVLDIISDILNRLGVELPEDTDTTIPARAKAALPWDEATMDIDYANMPLQSAIDFVSWLVLIQSGRFKFARGLPTVGGLTYVGIVTKTDGFRMIGEPDLEHKYTGFNHDF